MADPAEDVVAEAGLDQAEGTRGPTAVSVRHGLVRVTAVAVGTEVDLAAVVVSQPLRAGDRAGGKAAEGRWGLYPVNLSSPRHSDRSFRFFDTSVSLFFRLLSVLVYRQPTIRAGRNEDDECHVPYSDFHSDSILASVSPFGSFSHSIPSHPYLHFSPFLRGTKLLRRRFTTYRTNTA